LFGSIIWLKYKIVQADSSRLKPKIDSVVTIKAGLESLIARSIDKKTISNGPELSQLIYRYLQAVSENPAENDKVLVRQIRIQKLLANPTTSGVEGEENAEKTPTNPTEKTNATTPGGKEEENTETTPTNPTEIKNLATPGGEGGENTETTSTYPRNPTNPTTPGG